MPDLGIIFAHHTLNDATRTNLDSFRRWHSQGPIITVSGSDDVFEGGAKGKDFPLWDADKAWYNSDFLFYQGFRSRKVNCKRWLYVEWDCYCNLPVRDFLHHVWDFEIAAPCVRLPNREPEWHWFQDIGKLPERLRPYSMGVVPLAGTMVSDQLLTKIVDVVLAERVAAFNELRIATIGNMLGCAAVANPLGNTLTWSNNSAWVSEPAKANLPPGIWHPVKFAVGSLRVAHG
jgi:hypothetical protein